VIEIHINEDPVAWSRAARNNFRIYDPQLIAKKNFSEIVKTALGHHSYPIFCEGVKVFFDFHIAMPKSWSKKKRNELRGSLHQQKPDTSNLIKFPEDALKGILWEDDQLICQIAAQKSWQDEGKTVIYMTNVSINQGKALWDFEKYSKNLELLGF